MSEAFHKYLKFLREVSLAVEALELLEGHLKDVEAVMKKMGDVTDEFAYNVADMIEALIENPTGNNVEEEIVDDDIVELEEGEIEAREAKAREAEEKESEHTRVSLEEGFKAIINYIEDGKLYNPNNKYQEKGYMLIKKEEDTYKMGIKGTRGITTCGVCKGDNIIMHAIQTRGADEGESIFNTCADCGNKWYVR